MEIPGLLVQIAVIIILVRSAYVTFQLLQAGRKQWLDIAFHASIAVVALSVLM